MKRFTLIIDGHNFFFRSLWSVLKQGKNKVLTTQKDIDIYEKKLMVDFCTLIKSVGSIVNDIVFVEDSHSWRKDLLLQQEYKGNRKKSQDSIDSNGFSTVIGNFTNTLKELGIKVSQVYRSEGDDLISYWSDYLFKEGKSSLILSTDKDLTQLVKCVNDVHIIQYSPMSNKLYISKESNDIILNMKNKQITQENLFDEIFSISVECDSFEKFVDGTNIEVVNPEYVRFTKIIGGDVSDNIYSVYYKKSNDTGRSRGIGPKTVDKIYNIFKERLGCEFDYSIYYNEDAMKMLCNIIYDVMKINDDEFTRRMLLENIKTNTSLVSLTFESIPSDVIECIGENVLSESCKKQIVLSKINRDNIFSISRFKDYKSSIQLKSNILKSVKDDGDMSFIKD